MKLRSPLLQRSAQEIIAAFPSHVAIPGDHVKHSHPDHEVILVKPGEKGYWAPPYLAGKSLDEADAIHERVFKARKPTEAEREAASIGSMIGWGVPGADPENYVKEEQSHEG